LSIFIGFLIKERFFPRLFLIFLFCLFILKRKSNYEFFSSIILIESRFPIETLFSVDYFIEDLIFLSILDFLIYALIFLIYALTLISILDFPVNYFIEEWFLYPFLGRSVIFLINYFKKYLVHRFFALIHQLLRPSISIYLPFNIPRCIDFLIEVTNFFHRFFSSSYGEKKPDTNRNRLRFK
jgi:hypothetical protein